MIVIEIFNGSVYFFVNLVHANDATRDHSVRNEFSIIAF